MLSTTHKQVTNLVKSLFNRRLSYKIRWHCCWTSQTHDFATNY